MSPERWRQVRQILEDALELPSSKRTAFLTQACRDDAALRREVEALLAAADTAADFIATPPRQLAAAALAAPPGSAVGQTVAHYHLQKLLGRGGMGEVYLAEDERLRRKVAIKLLPAAYTNDRQRVRRFEQEARAASALNHPNILMIFEIGEAERGHYIVMEYVEGETLRTVPLRRKLALPETLDLAVQIASALSAAHGAGVIHRDLKPENVMLRPDGYVKVLDFGLAKLVEARKVAGDSRLAETETLPLRNSAKPSAGNSQSSLTAPGTVLGTVSYMSPEQARGQEVDARSDLFSLGILLYELLTGQLPFTGATASDILAAILLSEPPALSQSAPNCPHELQSIIARLLHKERAQRYQSAGALLADLRQLKQQLEWAAHEPAVTPRVVTAPTTQELVAPHTQSSAEYLVNQIKQHKRPAALALVALVLALAALLWLRFARGPSAPTLQEIDSVAVLPFTDAKPAAETEYLADGLADSIINRLSGLPGLKVMSLSSVLRYKGQSANAQSVGRELNVRAVLSGRVTQVGEQLLISAELVDARDHSHLWGQQYQRQRADLLAVQEEIASAVAESLRRRLSQQQRERVVKRYTENNEAYRLYLQGRFHWNKRSAEGLRRGIEFFQQAIEQDPAYALAHAGLADCYGLLSNYTSTPPKEALTRARAAARQALEIDAALAEAHTSIGLVKKEYEWDFPGAEAAFQRALELNPNYATARQWRAENLVNLKRHAEAMAELQQARELDPFSLIINGVAGWAFHRAGQYEQAVTQLRQTVELDQNFARSHFYLGRALAQQGKFTEAAAATERALQLSNNFSFFLASLGHIHGLAGQQEQARRILKQLQERAVREYVSPVAFALVAAGLDDKDEAFARLQQAVESRDTILVNYLFDPQFSGLQSDPRFTALARRVGLAQ